MNPSFSWLSPHRFLRLVIPKAKFDAGENTLLLFWRGSFFWNLFSPKKVNGHKLWRPLLSETSTTVAFPFFSYFNESISTALNHISNNIGNEKSDLVRQDPCSLFGGRIIPIKNLRGFILKFVLWNRLLNMKSVVHTEKFRKSFWKLLSPKIFFQVPKL